MRIDTEKIPYFFSISFLIEALTPEKLSTVSSQKGLKDLNINKFILASADIYQVLALTAERGLCKANVNLGESVKKVVTKAVRAPNIGTNVSLGYAILSVSLVYSITSVLGLGLSPTLKNITKGHELLKDSLTLESAASFYEGIRLAAEKHLGRYFGRVPDIREEPKSLSVWEVLEASSSDDSVAYEIVNRFPRTVEVCNQLQNYVSKKGLNVVEAVKEAQLNLLSKYPDTLVTKSFGHNAAVILKELTHLSRVKGAQYLKKLDRFLRDSGVNPGTTSDILSAGLGLYLVMSYGDLSC